MKGGRSLQILLVFVVQLQCLKSIVGASLGVSDSNISCIETERQALLKLKQGIIDDYGYLSSWGTEEEQNDCCRWSRIQCNNRTGNVVKLDLHSTFGMLRGEISPSLSNLQHLNYLDLSWTAFKLAGVPELLGSLSKLRYLNLSTAGLAGTFPYNIGNLSSLHSLDLSGNDLLKVESLQCLSHLSSLRYLDMSYVNLTKAVNWLQEINMLPSLVDLILVSCDLHDAIPTLPHYINFSTSLSTLDLSMNFLSRSIFTWLSNISTSLVDLRLKSNSLQGPIPDAFWNMTSLVHLDLSGNQLEGGIPKSMGNLCSLQTLDLSINQLTQFGDMANNLFSNCSANALEILRLQLNQLSGPLPNFTKCSSLRELRLDKNRLYGSIPKSFGHLSKLVLLDLQENQLSGSLPDLTKSLRVLRLSYNQLNGTLTKSTGKLSELVYLYASSNHFEGVISQVHLSNFSKLRYLDLSLNSLDFNLSSDWVPPFQLEALRLSSCKLGPQFPEWLQRLKNLSHLDLSNDGISDTIPSWFSELSPNLRYLNLSRNQIRGMIPTSLLKFANILDLSENHFEGPLPLFSSRATYLDLSHNMFSGMISSICQSTFLNLLDLSDNLLSGGIPNCWTSMTLLQVLSLANNNLSGKIPTSIGSLFFLQTLRLQNNTLSGELPLSLKNCGLLKHIHFGENRLFGKIPSWIGESLTMLITLSLRSNAFHGSIPLQLCHLTSIRILDLSHNNISGTIPRCFNNFSVMAKTENLGDPIAYQYLNGYIENMGYASLYLENALVTWKGRRDEYSKTLGLLKIIDLSSNNLSGMIPGQIMSLFGLVSLNLSRNNLTRTIPEMIGELQQLQSLDFSRNRLSGRIPAEMSNLNFLQCLDLSNNDLFGKIPSGTQLQSFNASAYSGNPKLCGPPLVEKCSEDEPPFEEDDINDKDGNWHGIPGYFVSAGIGFTVGFLGLCFTLLFKTSWRHAYFRFLENLFDKFYVMIAIKVAKLQRKFQS